MVKAPDFDSGMRGFESFLPSHILRANVKNRFPSSESSPTNDLMVFTGSANLQLAKDVTKNLAIKLGKASVSRFSDNEISIEILEHVRGKDIFVLQSTCFPQMTILWRSY